MLTIGALALAAVIAALPPPAPGRPLESDAVYAPSDLASGAGSDSSFEQWVGYLKPPQPAPPSDQTPLPLQPTDPGQPPPQSTPDSTPQAPAAPQSPPQAAPPPTPSNAAEGGTQLQASPPPSDATTGATQPAGTVPNGAPQPDGAALGGATGGAQQGGAQPSAGQAAGTVAGGAQPGATSGGGQPSGTAPAGGQSPGNAQSTERAGSSTSGAGGAAGGQDASGAPAATPARILGSIDVGYPVIARQRGIEGRVVLEVEVGVDGRARQVTVKRSSGHSLLDSAAAQAVTDARYIAATDGGGAVDSIIEVTITFRLENR